MLCTLCKILILKDFLLCLCLCLCEQLSTGLYGVESALPLPPPLHKPDTAAWRTAIVQEGEDDTLLLSLQSNSNSSCGTAVRNTAGTLQGECVHNDCAACVKTHGCTAF
jgi:hypothetical protein